MNPRFCDAITIKLKQCKHKKVKDALCTMHYNKQLKDGDKFTKQQLKFSAAIKHVEDNRKAFISCTLDKRIGTLTYGTGATYNGEILNNLPNGKGIITYTINGNSYEGEFADGKMTKGIYRFANGDSYDGKWKDDLMNGRGIYNYSNRDVYYGEFVNGHREGDGLYNFSNGDVYDGKFVNGKKEGRGVYTRANGTVYHNGYWINDMALREAAVSVAAVSVVSKKVEKDEVCIQGDKSCVVCLENKRKVIYNCGHYICCHTCSSKIDKCPTCRAKITSKMPVFD